jgi:hypothetical protein
MTSYRIETKIYSTSSDALPAALDAAKRAGVRPICLCREPGLPMYIAPVSGRLILKRMPGSGGNHSPACDSYEPPPELSGLGQVLGSAIQENPDVADRVEARIQPHEDRWAELPDTQRQRVRQCQD